ncbi:WYL domain-containing protein [Azonexus sp.]|uniref:WYL domain-containing protein n=1 Tax=Azonexus sp. TaxID=1872668 RepID=UPI0035AF1B55
MQEAAGAQRERLAYVDFRLFFLGEISRADISGRFDVTPAVATRDFARYRKLAANNIRFDCCSKTYRATDDFRPVFEHSLDRALSALTKGFGDGLGGAAGALLPCEYPVPINRPAVELLAAVTRAIAGRRVLSVSYVSLSSGATEREIVPLALADNGMRWHVRAFDRRTSSFRDFVLTRVRGIRVLPEKPLPEESIDYDVQWSREIEIEVVPHPDFPRPELAALDYPMTDGVLRIRTKAALAGYVLRRWSVDCSEAHSLRGPEYRLWLRNRSALSGADSAPIAPGYFSQDGGRG